MPKKLTIKQLRDRATAMREAADHLEVAIWTDEESQYKEGKHVSVFLHKEADKLDWKADDLENKKVEI